MYNYLKLWYYKVLAFIYGGTMAKEVSVGIRLDGSLDVDFQDEEDSTWNLNNVSIEKAEFLIEELTHAITRARPRAQKRAEALKAEEARKAAAEALKAAAPSK